MHGELLGERYRIRELLGEGGMARVYVAVDEKLGRKVAIKVLHQHFADNLDVRQRFEMEATAISSMDHPNVLKVFDFSGSSSKQLWIVTEILKGRNLAQFAQTFQGSAVHVIIATCIVRELTKALEHAHNCKLIHRDIKPENVMVLASGGIKLMDFGIAKNLHTNSVTLTGTFMGSPSYMSPEQVRGRNIDLRSDIYSLGVLFYEIVTGKLPYIGNTTHDVIIKIVEGRFLSPRQHQPNLPVEIDKIICKAMSKDADRRYQAARSLARDLDIFLQRHGFVESHVELERFFADPRAYEAKLQRRLQAPTQRTRSPGQYGSATTTKDRTRHNSKLVNVSAYSHGTRYGQATSVRTHNDAAIAQPYPRTLAEREAARLAVQNVTRKDRQLHRNRPTKGRRSASNAPNNATEPLHLPLVMRSETSITSTVRDQATPAQPALPKRRRVRPPAPKRTRPKPVLIYRQRPNYSEGHGVFFGFLVVGLLIFVGLAGFWGLHEQLQTQTTPSPLPVEKKAPAGGHRITPKEQTLQAPSGPSSRPSASKPVAMPRSSISRPTNRNPDRLKPNRPPQSHQIATPVVPKQEGATAEGGEAAAIQPPSLRPMPRVEDTQKYEVSSETKQASPLAAVWIASNVSANIVINGKSLGTTVDATYASGWKELPSGRHTIELQRPGYETYRLNLNLQPGEKRRLGNISLKRAQEARQVPLTIHSEQVPVKITLISESGVESRVMQSSPLQLSLAEGTYSIKLEHQSKSIDRRVNVRSQHGPLSISVDFSRH